MDRLNRRRAKQSKSAEVRIKFAMLSFQCEAALKWETIRLGIDDIIRTISIYIRTDYTYFVVVSEIPNAKCTRNPSEMRLKNIDDTIDP
jgi:hypothetical protein